MKLISGINKKIDTKKIPKGINANAAFAYIAADKPQFFLKSKPTIQTTR